MPLVAVLWCKYMVHLCNWTGLPAAVQMEWVWESRLLVGIFETPKDRCTCGRPELPCQYVELKYLGFPKVHHMWASRMPMYIQVMDLGILVGILHAICAQDILCLKIFSPWG